MIIRKTISFTLLFCLLAALLAPAAAAADDAVQAGFSDRWSPLLGEGLDALTDWLDGKADRLAPELRETLRNMDTDALFEDLKALVGETRGMDDEELRGAVLALAQKHGVHLLESQVKQLMKLCRTLENLDSERLRERFETLEKAIDAPEGLRSAWNTVVTAITNAAGWLVRTVGGWFR